jgi:hypothetical protein
MPILLFSPLKANQSEAEDILKNAQSAASNAAPAPTAAPRKAKRDIDSMTPEEIR